MSYMKADGMEVYCIMVRKGWVTPKAMVEGFEANEYVAACYSVVCNVDEGQTHSSTACGAPGNYYVMDNNNDGKFDGMIEISSDLGRLPCTIYTGADYGTTASWSGISSGQTIYWTTSTSDGSRTWHHQGVVGLADPGHPNRS